MDEPLRHDLPRLVQEGMGSIPSVENRTPLVAKPQQGIESWRVFKIMAEFVEGFDIIRRYTKAASFFGSERTMREDPFYANAEELSRRLATLGYAVITGGAQGIMQAANQGAYEAGGASVGLNIRLPSGQRHNQYLTDTFEFDHFFVRKVMLTYSSELYVYFPGGFGTLDEFLEILTLVQTKKIRRIPIILFGKSFWQPLIDYFRTMLLEKRRSIDAGDLELFHVVDSVDEAMEYIMANVPS
jgi:uncharacterized protein (TIGR00730 family)